MVAKNEFGADRIQLCFFFARASSPLYGQCCRFRRTGLPLCRLPAQGRKKRPVAATAVNRRVIAVECYQKKSAVPAGGVVPCARAAVFGVPRAAGGLACLLACRSGLVVFSACLGVFVLCLSWRCCFSAWLRLPGEPVRACAGSACPLRPFCSGRSSLVPGVPAEAGSAAALRLSRSPVGARRRVCLAWLRRAGLPFGFFVGSCFALPFPSVLSAAWRAGVVPSLWARCLRARAAFRAWLASGCRRG